MNLVTKKIRACEPTLRRIWIIWSLSTLAIKSSSPSNQTTYHTTRLLTGPSIRRVLITESLPTCSSKWKADRHSKALLIWINSKSKQLALLQMEFKIKQRLQLTKKKTTHTISYCRLRSSWGSRFSLHATPLNQVKSNFSWKRPSRMQPWTIRLNWQPKLTKVKATFRSCQLEKQRTHRALRRGPTLATTLLRQRMLQASQLQTDWWT